MRRPIVLTWGLVALAMIATSVSHAAATDRVTIQGDGAFAAYAEGGDGTAGNPWILTGRSILASGGYGIELKDTTAHVNITGVTVTSGGASSDGIKLNNVRNVVVWGATLEGNRYGVYALNSRDVVVGGSTIKTSKAGVYLEGSQSVTLRDNRLAVNERNVEFKASSGNTLQNNNLSTATGQYGLFFDGNASYDNAIDTSNVVNSIPLQWHTRVSGTSGAPLVISAATMDLRGATNVAQVMIHNASHVRLEAPIAKASASGAAGIHVYNSANVVIEAPIAEGNGGAGIFVELSRDVAIANGTARANARQGILLQSSPDVSVAASNLSANEQEGLKASASSRATLRESALYSNLGGAILINGSGESTIRSNVVSGAAMKEITLDGATPYQLLQNDVTATNGGVAISRSAGNAQDNVVRARGNAFAFTATTGNNLTGNNVTLLVPGAIGFAFDQALSYDNNVTTTNVVNGTPVRWYNRLVGTEATPVVLSDLRSELKGITNVAQIMLYRTSNVTLDTPVAHNGAAHGIVSWDSDDTLVLEAAVRSNAQDGVVLSGGARPALQSSSVEKNGASGVRVGNATSASVENNVIGNNTGRGVLVEGGRLAQIRGNGILSNGGAGVHLLNTGSGGGVVIDNNLVRSNGGVGALVESSAASSIRANNLTTNAGDGIHLKSASPGARIEDNVIVGHARGIHFTISGGQELYSNTINLTQAGTHGLYFDDETSYNATIPPSNLVNGTPVRWYVATTGPITGVDANVTGLTNVAQVMIYRAQNATLTDAIVANGSARGVYVLRSANVTIQGGNVTANAKSGVHVDASADVRANATLVTRNRENGILVAASPRSNLTNLSVLSNALKGVSFEASDGAALANATIEGNGAVGVSFWASSGAPGRATGNAIRHNAGGMTVDGAWLSDVADNVLLSNYPTGISFANVNRTVNVTSNVFTLHERGIQLTRSEGGVHRGNVMSIGLNHTAYHFSDETSYNNSIDTSNLVNTIPMRWYTNLVGPVTLSGIRAEVRGMTNVAQVMLYKSSNVTFDDTRGISGTLHGIYVFRSNDTTIDGSVASSNNGTGVSVYASRGVTLRNSTLADNGQNGAFAELSDGFLVERATVDRSGIHGIAVKTSNLSSVLHSTIRFSAQRGISAVTSPFFNASFNVVANSTRDGISVESQSQSPRIYDNHVNGSASAGILLSGVSQGARVEGNRLASNARGVQLATSTYAEIHANEIAINATQIGFSFDDEDSYNNVIPRTNLVNGKPVHWFTTLTGTESSPVRLENVTAEVPGMTNVAQVMIYKSAYVNASGVVATNGVSRGLYLYKSSSIGIDGVNAAGSPVGVDLKQTQSSTVSGALAVGSSVAVRLTESLSNVVTDVDARGASPGVSLDAASQQNRVDRITVNGTLARGVTDASSVNAFLLGKNLVVDAGPGKRIKVGGQTNITDNTASYRHDSERIVNQTWSWGDGTNVSSTSATIFRPNHTYTLPGTFSATYTVVTADGKILWDIVLVQVIPPLSEPYTLAAEPGDRNVTLRWEPPISDAGINVTKYRVFRATDGANFTQVGGDLGNVRNYTDSGLVNGRTYQYRVAAVNAEGQGPNATIEATPLTLPFAPRALNASARDAAVALTWQVPTDDGGRPIRGYVVLRAANGSAFQEAATLGNVTEHVDTGLQNGVNYTYAVRAYSLVGNGMQSANASATPVGMASEPRNFTALPTDAAAVLAWRAPNATGGSPIVGYRVFRGASPELLLPLVDLGADETQHKDIALSNGQSYYYAVAALNTYGAGVQAGPFEVIPTGEDALRPVVLEATPANDAVLVEGGVTIVARYVDNNGVVPESIELHVDGNPVVLNGSAGPNELRWTSPEPLARGFHSVRLILRDAAGNEAVRDWGFSVQPEDEPLAAFEVEAFTVEPGSTRAGRTVYANVTVRNTGLGPGSYNVTVRSGERVLAERMVELAAGEALNASLAFAAPEVGTYTLTVEDQNATLRVESGGRTNSTTTKPPTPPGNGKIKVPAVPLGALLALGAAATLLRRR